MDTFDAEVRAGYWPQAKRRGAKAGRLTWDRVLLDQAADRFSGMVSAPTVPTTQSDSDAWEERLNATATKERHKRRPQAAR